jgi:hypothetical protein
MNGLRVTALVVGLSVALAAKAQTQVPNVFQAGEPARAADVNENFSALGEAANDNAAKIANNASSIAVNASSIDGNADAIAAANSNVSQNVAAIQANLDSIAQVQETIVDRRPSLVDRNGVEVGRISQIDGSNTFTIEATVSGYNGILRWHPDRPGSLMIQGSFSNVFFDGPCSSTVTFVTVNTYVAVAGLLPIVTGQVYAVDTSVTGLFAIDYELLASTSGVGCRSASGSSTQEGFALVDLGTPWTPPFSVK